MFAHSPLIARFQTCTESATWSEIVPCVDGLCLLLSEFLSKFQAACLPRREPGPRLLHLFDRLVVEIETEMPWGEQLECFRRSPHR